MNITHEKIPELFVWINANPYEEIGRLNAEQTAERRKPKWRLRDRLTEKELVRLVMAFQTGIATKALAERYDISVSSIKRLQREYGTQMEDRSMLRRQ